MRGKSRPARSPILLSSGRPWSAQRWPAGSLSPHPPRHIVRTATRAVAGSSSRLQRSRRLRRHCDNHVGPQRDQLLPECVRSIRIRRRKSVIDADVRPSNQPNRSSPAGTQQGAPAFQDRSLRRLPERQCAAFARACCARAASGHAAAAPPSSAMNSRRCHSITSSARGE